MGIVVNISYEYNTCQYMFEVTECRVIQADVGWAIESVSTRTRPGRSAYHYACSSSSGINLCLLRPATSVIPFPLPVTPTAKFFSGDIVDI
jgi:hypothetical protein